MLSFTNTDAFSFWITGQQGRYLAEGAVFAKKVVGATEKKTYVRPMLAAQIHAHAALAMTEDLSSRTVQIRMER